MNDLPLKKTKIICTIGPASQSQAVLQQIGILALDADQQKLGIQGNIGKGAVDRREVDAAGPGQCLWRCGIDDFIVFGGSCLEFCRGKALHTAMQLVFQDLYTLDEGMDRCGKRRGVAKLQLSQIFYRAAKAHHGRDDVNALIHTRKTDCLRAQNAAAVRCENQL